jgi:hypothetical protein
VYGGGVVSLMAADPAPRRRALRRPTSVRWTALILGLAFAGGFVATAAAYQIVNGSETAHGSYVGQLELTWWKPTEVLLTTIPASTTAASTNPASPTVIPAAGTTYAVNTATHLDNALEFIYSEQTTAVASTELEITFTVTAGTTTTVTVYIETQSTIPATAQTFNFLFDGGSATAVFHVWQQTTQVCPSVGSCP